MHVCLISLLAIRGPTLVLQSAVIEHVGRECVGGEVCVFSCDSWICRFYEENIEEYTYTHIALQTKNHL